MFYFLNKVIDWFILLLRIGPGINLNNWIDYWVFPVIHWRLRWFFPKSQMFYRSGLSLSGSSLCMRNLAHGEGLISLGIFNVFFNDFLGGRLWFEFTIGGELLGISILLHNDGWFLFIWELKGLENNIIFIKLLVVLFISKVVGLLILIEIYNCNCFPPSKARRCRSRPYS